MNERDKVERAYEQESILTEHKAYLESFLGEELSWAGFWDCVARIGDWEKQIESKLRRPPK